MFENGPKNNSFFFRYVKVKNTDQGCWFLREHFHYRNCLSPWRSCFQWICDVSFSSPSLHIFVEALDFVLKKTHYKVTATKCF